MRAAGVGACRLQQRLLPSLPSALPGLSAARMHGWGLACRSWGKAQASSLDTMHSCRVLHFVDLKSAAASERRLRYFMTFP